jgi:hypothetical protein
MILWKTGHLRFAMVATIGVAALWPLLPRAKAGEKTPIGQRIQFSDGSTAPQVPLRRPEEGIPSKPFEFLDRNNSISGVVAPLALPSPGSFPSLQNNPKLRELFEQKLDEKKNWIYRTSDDLTHLGTVNEMFGVQEREIAGRSPKSRKSLERFFESKNPKPTADTAGDEWIKRNEDKYDYNLDPDKRRGKDAGLRYAQPIDPGRMMTAGFALPTDWSGSAAARNPLNDTAGFRNDRSDLAKAQRESADDFRKLLVTPGINPLAAGFNPLNLGVDTTAQGYSPIAPLVPAQSTLPTLAGALTGKDAGASRLNSLADRETKPLGASSLSPVITAPTTPAPPYFKPSPATVDLPQRKF